jgi:hypothetical protein
MSSMNIHWVKSATQQVFKHDNFDCTRILITDWKDNVFELTLFGTDNKAVPVEVITMEDRRTPQEVEE